MAHVRHKVNDSFEKMLSYVCLCVAQEIPEGNMGRPRLFVNDMIYSAVMKVVREEAVRPFMSYLQDARERGLINNIPSYQAVWGFFKRQDTRQSLIRTIICTVDLLSLVPRRKRIHTSVRFAAELRLFGRTYEALMNEILCAKIAEMTVKCDLYGVQITSRLDSEMADDSLLALLRKQIPDSLPKHIRDELYQELVVAVLDGQIAPEMIRNKVGSLLRRVRSFEPSRLSLNAPIYSDRPMTRLDLIRAY